jgi:hypothetical protein
MKLAITCILFICLAASAWAGDIVTMPTANQLHKGEVDLAYYYLSLDLPEGAPQHVNYQTVYVGFTDKFERQPEGAVRDGEAAGPGGRSSQLHLRADVQRAPRD